MEREAMEQINRNLASIRKEYEKNKEFIGRGFKLPPEFILDGYDDPPTPTTRPTTMENPGNPQPETQEPTPTGPIDSPEAGTTEEESENPPAPEPTIQTPDPEANQTKQPRMLSRLSDDLNGPLWRIEPLATRTRRVVYTIEYADPTATPEDGTLEPVYVIEYKDPGAIPEDIHPEHDTDTYGVAEITDAPEQETIVNRDI